jgi:hypothetical protein
MRRLLEGHPTVIAQDGAWRCGNTASTM